MKKFAIVAVSLLLAANTAFADDWFFSPMNPTSPTNMITNPMNSWHPGNIYHSLYNDNYYNRGMRTHYGYYYSPRRIARRYNVCVRYAGGVACKSILY